MSSVNLEAFLARLYTDKNALNRFLDDQALELAHSALSEDEKVLLANVDRAGLVLAFNSFYKKRTQHQQKRQKRSFWKRIISVLRSSYVGV